MAIPKAPVKRIIKEEGAERVSADAVDTLVEFLEDDAEAIAKKAIEYAKYAKRQTVKAEDIALAIGKSETSGSSVKNKHNLLDVIKDVFEAASEGKGIEEIIKGFMKLEKQE
ncbi:histone family protein [Methanobrevibacter sp. YE315]|uniref:histone family protein n=1 Tax=Methanobrevibacter sp. YE315 TaxID=1609968 RepID=UPI0009E7A75B